jgi:phosphatidylglycerol:prolipoprotein diacylglycerol transferase
VYPRFSDLIKDVFGVDIPLPFSSFGIMLAFAFLVGCYFFALELWRKEEQGLIKPIRIKKIPNEKLPIRKLIKNASLGFIIGFKLLWIVFHYNEFTRDALSYIFSLRGNWWGGLIGTIVGIIQLIYAWRKRKDKPEDEKESIIHPYQQIGKMALMATIFCFIGARLFYYFEDIDRLINDPINSMMKGGLNIYGGLIFGGGYIIFFIKRTGLNLLHFGDACAPALMIAYGIARMGCQLSGDGDWGIPNDTPKPSWMSFLPDWVWAYNYPNNALGVDLKSYFIELGYESTTGNAWPTPLYELLICLIFFMILWNLRKKIIIPGLLFSIYLVLNGLERFTIEIIRTNPRYQLLGFSATMAQWIAVVLICVGGYGIWYFSFNREKTNDGIQQI